MAGNTTPIHGKVARTAYGTAGSGTAIDYTDGYTLNVTLDTAVADRQGQSWHEFLAGMAGWSGSFTGMLVAGNTQQKAIYDNIISATPGTKLTGATALSFLLEDTGDYVSGDSYITGVSINAPVGDKVSFTVNFQGTGVLALTVA